MRAVPWKAGAVTLALAALSWKGAGNLSRTEDYPLDTAETAGIG